MKRKFDTHAFPAIGSRVVYYGDLRGEVYVFFATGGDGSAILIPDFAANDRIPVSSLRNPGSRGSFIRPASARVGSAQA